MFKAKKTKETRTKIAKRLPLPDRVFLEMTERIETKEDSVEAALLAVESLCGRHELLRGMQSEWPLAPMLSAPQLQDHLDDVWRAIRTPPLRNEQLRSDQWGKAKPRNQPHSDRLEDSNGAKTSVPSTYGSTFRPILQVFGVQTVSPTPFVLPPPNKPINGSRG